MMQETDFENGRISYYKGLVTLTLILDGHMAYPCCTHRPLPIPQISFKSDKKCFLWKN